MENKKVKKPLYKRWWFIVIAVFIVLGVIGSALGGEDSKDTNQITNNELNKDNNADNNKKNEEKKEEPKETEKKAYVNTAVATELFTGEFLVGKDADVQPGRYDITCKSGSGNLFVYDNGLPEVNEILAATADDALGMGVTKVTFDLEEGQKIDISGIDCVVLSPATVELRTTLCAGKHLVGRDVPSGSYIASAPSGSGNFFVYSKYGIPRVNEILGKDDFGFSVEKVKIVVEDGEYIVISGIETVELTK